MGGGEGAKERRRQKRLAQGAPGKPATKHPKPGAKFEKKEKNPYTSRKTVNKKLGNKRPSPGPKKAAGKKKPKHLKRKLEQLEEGDAAREQLVKEMADFQTKKEQFAANVESKKRRRKEKPSAHEDKRVTPAEREKGESRVGKTNIRSANAKVQPSKDTSITEELSNHDDPKQSGERAPAEPEDAVQSQPSEKKATADSLRPTKESDNESDGDEEDSPQRRQRGRRRRGRKDTAKQIELTEARRVASAPETNKPDVKAVTEDNSSRYCVGRKPVTDFVIGQSYPAKVVYVKPFGVFFDIGCHSDAFCHVSRLSDEYVESSSDLFKEGDNVDARVVEIDRKQKKITVSMQSEARIEDEKTSIEKREQRKQLRESKSRRQGNINHSSARSSPAKQEEPSTSLPQKQEVEKPKPIFSSQPLDEANMTPAELKRARKLARRAERREQATA